MSNYWQARTHTEKHVCPKCKQEIAALVTVPQTGFGDTGIMVNFENRCEHLGIDGMSYSYEVYECSLELAIKDCFD